MGSKTLLKLLLMQLYVWYVCTYYIHETVCVCVCVCVCAFLRVNDGELINRVVSSWKKSTSWKTHRMQMLLSLWQYVSIKAQSRAGLSCQLHWPPPHPPTHITSTHLKHSKELKRTKKKEEKTEGKGKEEAFSDMTAGEILERSLYSKLTSGEPRRNDKTGWSTHTHHWCQTIHNDNNNGKQ